MPYTSVLQNAVLIKVQNLKSRNVLLKYFMTFLLENCFLVQMPLSQYAYTVSGASSSFAGQIVISAHLSVKKSIIHLN